MDPLVHGYVHGPWHPNNHLGETLTSCVRKKKKNCILQFWKNAYTVDWIEKIKPSLSKYPKIPLTAKLA